MAHKGEKIVRIGGASGFWGDSSVAAPQLVRGAKLDYLVFDYLAETTMALLAAARRKNPDAGYATDFVEVAMRGVLPDIAAKGIRVVANAGGLNAAGCARALGKLAAEMGVSLKIAVVEGDDIFPRLAELRASGRLGAFGPALVPENVMTANAYLGALPVARALDQGADIVITGRTVDSAVTLGPLIHEFGWAADDYDRLAAGSLAGHIIECGCQATGGLFTDWETVPDWPNIGYPIIECAGDGSFAVTKPENTGGLIARACVAEQLVYEIGDPAAYILPDVVCDFRAVTIRQDDPSRVIVSGARGFPPTDSYKVSATYVDGFRAAGTMVIVGIDAVRKAERTGAAILERTRRIFAEMGLPDYTATHIEVLGGETLYGPHSRTRNAREVMMRVTVNHTLKQALAIFGREIAPSGTSWSPGTTMPAGPRPTGSPLVRQVAFLVPKAELRVQVKIGDDAQDIDVPLNGGFRPDDVKPVSVPAPLEPADAPPADQTRRVRLVELAFVRSGDKGDISNIGVIARRPEYWPVILEQLTVERVKSYFSHLMSGEVRRYLLPGISACNFVLEGALDGGGQASMRIDPLGKGMGQMLLDIELDVPRTLQAETIAA